ncbi:MAG: DUF5752 family protein [Chloroflexota bacterium]|nr:DUF5752 family protein [Chloroflexota bacterium]
MNSIINWIQERWSTILIPAAVFTVAMIAMFWLRRLAYDALERWLKNTQWQGHRILVLAIRGPSIIWGQIISIYLALAVSGLPAAWKNPASKGLWTLLLISLTLAIINIVSGLIQFYGRRLRVPYRAIVLSRNITRIVILIVAILVLLDIWGAPTSPLLLLIAVIVLAAALAFRDAAPNLFAGFQLGAGTQIKVGDYIKLETGEEGYVVRISWNNTHVKALDERTIIVPNSRLIQHTVINYGHPLKKAREPFRFSSRTHLTELTGLKAKNLPELAATLKTASDAVVYYHTHRFLEEHHYLTPELSNDFAIWVNDALGDEVLGERLASVDTFGFPSLGTLRERLVSIVEEYLAAGPYLREAMEDREFHFMKSVSAIFPTAYVAHDLREFVEALRKISLGSLYFHIFESRLRLGRGLNDFTIWLKDSLDESDLGEEIARLDPYTYTLEGLRSSLIQLIEKRIK